MAIDRKRIYHKRDRLWQLQAFCRAAQLGSFMQAAESLGVTQPSVSFQVRELENELETFLFDRSVSGIELTRAGQRFFELAEPLVQGAAELSVASTDQFDEAMREHLQLAASTVGAACVLPRFVAQYRNLYPNVRLTVRNGPLREGLELLLADEVEFTLGVKESYREDSLQYREVLTYEIVLVTALDHPLAARETVSPKRPAPGPRSCRPPVPTAGSSEKLRHDSSDSTSRRQSRLADGA